MVDLKPCPFCGGEFPLLQMFLINSFELRYVVVCGNCKARTKACKAGDIATELWNRRVDNA